MEDKYYQSSHRIRTYLERQMMATGNLIYYNHNECSLPMESVVKNVSKSCGLNFEEFGKIADWLNNSKVGILHGKPEVKDANGKPPVRRDYYKHLLDKSVCSADKLVVLFVSSVEIYTAAKRVEFRSNNNTTGIRYLLPVPHTKRVGLSQNEGDRNEQEAVKEKWKSLLSAILDTNSLDSWFARKRLGNEHGILDEVFNKPLPPKYLPALTILCQGYLAVHAKKENGKWGPPDILPALKQMGWLDFICGPGKSLLPQDLDKRKSEVSQAGWWLEPFDLLNKNNNIQEKWVKFKESLRKEWGKGKLTLPEEITGLLEPLRENGCINDPKIVADAYCGIVENLGGTPCSSI